MLGGAPLLLLLAGVWIACPHGRVLPLLHVPPFLSFFYVVSKFASLSTLPVSSPSLSNVYAFTQLKSITVMSLPLPRLLDSSLSSVYMFSEVFPCPRPKRFSCPLSLSFVVLLFQIEDFNPPNSILCSLCGKCASCFSALPGHGAPAVLASPGLPGPLPLDLLQAFIPAPCCICSPGATVIFLAAPLAGSSSRDLKLFLLWVEHLVILLQEV